MDFRIQSNIDHYNNRRLRAYCCGCIEKEYNCILICFFWAAISFYFAILAFMQKSPFYSYVQDVPLIAFGAINLMFGIVTLASMIIFTIKLNIFEQRNTWAWWFQPNLPFFNAFEASSTTVYAITANALGVLIVTLVNFILFIINKDAFDDWCLDSSSNYIVQAYNSTNAANATVGISILGDKSAMAVYNCERVYQVEIKWSLLCMIIMFIVYIHWILIIAAKKSYQFYRHTVPLPAAPPPIPPTGITEFANMAPSSAKRQKKSHTFKNISAKGLLSELLVHKQYGEFKDGCIEIDTIPSHNNLIQFEQDLYQSSEISCPSSAYQTKEIVIMK